MVLYRVNQLLLVHAFNQIKGIVGPSKFLSILALHIFKLHSWTEKFYLLLFLVAVTCLSFTTVLGFSSSDLRHNRVFLAQSEADARRQRLDHRFYLGIDAFERLGDRLDIVWIRDTQYKLGIAL